MSSAEQRPREYPEQIMNVLRGLHNAFHQDDHADFIIKCKNREWKVHKLVCGWHFATFEEHLDIPKEEGEDHQSLSMDDFDPEVVGGLVWFLYYLDYDAEIHNKNKDTADIVFDVRMYVVAALHMIDGLRDLAMENFEKRCKDEWASPDFAMAVKELYEWGDAYGCEDAATIGVAASTVSAHASEIFDAERAKEFKDLLKVLATTRLGHDVARELAEGQ